MLRNSGDFLAARFGTQGELEIFPNPGDENLTVNIPGSQDYTLVFYDLEGRKIREKSGYWGEGYKQFSTQNLSVGVYLFHLQ